tara:strand:- start:86 stop:589 length:504 start_codon:yes stop_codon:yes gene_type:complete
LIDETTEQRIEQLEAEVVKWKAEAREWEDISIATFEQYPDDRYDEGYKAGYDEGYKAGDDEGHEIGYRNGYLQFGVERPHHFFRSSFLLAMNTRAQDVRIALIESRQRARALARESESEPESESESEPESESESESESDPDPDPDPESESEREVPWLSRTPEHSFDM